MKYGGIIENLSASIIKHFDEVYHSAEIVRPGDQYFPAINDDGEWPNLAPTDQREIIYIRRNGDDEVMEDLKLGSCIKSYKIKSQLRVVYFRDHAKKHNEILTKLMQSVLIGGTKLNRVVQDKWKLQKEESSGQYNLGATSAYFAIDIYALWELKPDMCEEDFCIDITNPLKKNC